MTDTARFAIPLPEDADPPNGPAQLQSAAEAIEARLGYAGAQGGKAVIATEQTRSNAAYGLLGTPDRIDDLVVENDGDLLIVDYSALWRINSGLGGGATAAIFLDPGSGAVQLKSFNDAGAPAVQEVSNGGGVDFDWLRSAATGLVHVGSGSGDGSVVTTGMLAGQLCVIERLAAGTYDISVQFKTAGGSTVAVKERRLTAWTKEFPTSGI